MISSTSPEWSLRETLSVVPVGAAGWESEAERRLLEDGVVGLAGPAAAVRSAVLVIASRPLDTGLLLSYPRVREARKDGVSVTVVVELPEGER